MKTIWLHSDSFWKRTFAVWGHYTLANALIAGSVFAVVVLAAIL